MEKQKKQELVNTLMVQTSTHDYHLMNDFIISELSKMGGITYHEDNGNIYATKGITEIYPCVVAHTDTVHSIVDNFVVYEVDDKLFSIDADTIERVGIGGDDKVGVFIALQTIKALDACKVAFFRDEEMGCIGSSLADMKFFDDCGFILQCDREGYGDFVNSIYGCDLYTKEFSDVITDTLQRYGRRESDGGMTDVYQLAKDDLPICVANMSCGYYDPHSDNEFVVLTHVNKTLNMVLEICYVASGKVWKMDKSERYTYSNYGHGNAYGYGGRDDGYDAWGDDEGYYSRVLPRHETDQIDDKGIEDFPCPDCLEKCLYDENDGIHYCVNCEHYIYPTIDELGQGYDLVTFEEQLEDFDETE